MSRKEPWWTCCKCGAPIARVGKRHPWIWDDHRKLCDPLAGGSIVQWTQRELKEWRLKNPR